MVNAEKAEKEMREAEEALRKAQERIEQKNNMARNGIPESNVGAERNWFQPSVNKKSKNKILLSKRAEEKRAAAKKDPQDRKFENDMAFHAREAKRGKKLKKMRVFNESDGKANKKGKNAKKSSFTSEITNVGRKSVKRHRFG